MPPQLPGHHPIHDLAAFWLQQLDQPDQVLLDAQQIAAHNARVRELTHKGLPSGRWSLDHIPLDWPRLQGRWREQLRALRQAAAEGKRVLLDGNKPDRLVARLERDLARAKPAGELRLVHRTTPLRCYPADEGLYEYAWDTAFDLAQCAQLRVGEAVRVLAHASSHWYVWSTYAHGWVDPRALTPPVEPEQARPYLEPERFVVVQRDRLALWADRDGHGLLTAVGLGVRLPLAPTPESRPARAGGPLRVSVPTPTGLGTAWIRDPDAVSVGYPPLTRRNVLRRAFSLLHTPYGWGGLGGHRDCSRFMLDLFAAFGVELPRNSWNQSQAGTRHVEVKDLDVAAKREAIQQAAKQGIVLLYLPGHIMLYLGRDDDRLFALHQFSGYLVPCKGAPKGAKPQRGVTETMVRVNRAAVTSLELGRGTSRRAFIERITRLVLLAPPQEPAAEAAAP